MLLLHELEEPHSLVGTCSERREEHKQGEKDFLHILYNHIFIATLRPSVAEGRWWRKGESETGRQCMVTMVAPKPYSWNEAS